MKILALSLLRIGDFFQQVHLFKEVVARNPGADFHLVCFSDINAVEALYPDWNFHFIPRTEIQRELVERERPWYRGLYLLEESLQSVFAMDWSLVLNPNHTAFSARLMDCFSGVDKRGTQFHQGQTAGWNQELHFLNDYYRALPTPEESWIDLTAKALGFSLPPAPETPLRLQGEIWLNPMTSDLRKNWPLESWKSLAEALKSVGHRLRILGSPSEKDWLESQFPNIQIGAWSFGELKEKSSQCRLLISGDTSVPHFLAHFQVPMISLFLGPANPHKTAPRLKASSCLATNLKCAPCEHRGGCSQPTQICSRSIQVRDVLQVVQYQLNEKKINEVILSQEVSWFKSWGAKNEKELSERHTSRNAANGEPASTMADTA